MSLKVLEATSDRLNLRINAGFYVLLPVALVLFVGGCLTLNSLAFRAEIRLEQTSLSYRQLHFDFWETSHIQIPLKEIEQIHNRVPADSWLNSTEIQIQTASGSYTFGLPGSDGDFKEALAEKIRAASELSHPGLIHTESATVPGGILGIMLLLGGILSLYQGKSVSLLLDGNTKTVTIRSRRWLSLFSETLNRPLQCLVSVNCIRASEKPHYGLAGFQVQLGFSSLANKRETDELHDLASQAFFTETAAQKITHVIHVWLELHGSPARQRRTRRTTNRKLAV